MRVLAHLFVPGHHNYHHPHFIRHPALNLLLYGLLLFTFLYNSFNPTGGRVLGFATEISTSQVIDLTNSERSKQGLGELKPNSLLALAAQEKANYMFEKNFWAHNAPDGTTPWYFIEKNGYKYTSAGENLARDFYTSSAVVQAWMDSPGHKANILNENYTEIGIGVVNGKLDGKETTLVVQMFGKPVAGASDTKASSNNAIHKENEAKPAVVPTTILPTPIEVAQELLLPNSQRPNQGAVFGNYSPTPTSFASQIVRSFTTLSIMQKVYLTLITIMIATFAFDSYLLYRRKLWRFSSHSITHTVVLLVALIPLIFSGSGFVG